jgi:hypothetical protein
MSSGANISLMMLDDPPSPQPNVPSSAYSSNKRRRASGQFRLATTTETVTVGGPWPPPQRPTYCDPHKYRSALIDPTLTPAKWFRKRAGNIERIDGRYPQVWHWVHPSAWSEPPRVVARRGLAIVVVVAAAWASSPQVRAEGIQTAASDV